ncbi:uncharacterized protein LOC107882766 [Acyrthosiphon pisum]|uniref:ACYPI35728 protein n=1 Tax=Acyrthosiphon pisum TaxID=7029 RepID=C4WWX1_ACYPI|nr:uncharacterized protein LOC100302457 [Acyrthosiphon pisum]XP_029348391.1 uncharacterized protein LOC107882766 [Acyrthosiphon pisum]BAH72391.1 ACYPI35728 [Acyrthosiphon pisum]|eukprot:NP_001156651.1 uncharacterized protein LOC100302457 [Acyrthosiphon pisum]
MIIKTFGLILFFSLSESKNNFRPNLPLGEYRLVIDKVYPCGSRINHSVQFNIYSSKKTSNITEMKGNITFLTPFNDNLAVDINFSSWGSTGGWIPNYYIFRGKKACSNLRNLTGNSWFTFVKAFNIPTDRCPIPVDTYITSGYDLTKFEDNNLPKVFFYGKYKVVVRYKNVENKEVGCMVSEINFIRPWETPI